MTEIEFSISAVDYSRYVQRVQINKESQGGIGTWEILMDPWPNNYHGNFIPGNEVAINIDSVKMLGGYIDDPKPFYDGGVDVELFRILGRDYGFDLASLYLSKLYDKTNWRADDIIEDALIQKSSEISLTSLSTAPFINFEFDRTYLADGFKEIANNVDYDLYTEVTKVAGNVVLQFFEIGDAFQHTGVELRSVGDEITNNILWWEKGDGLGANLRNYVELISGQLDDHWTEMNAADWVGVNCTIYDLLAHATVEPFLFGRASLFATNETGVSNQMSIYLDFSGGKYEYNTLDLRKDAKGFFSYVIHNTYLGPISSKTLRPRLQDTSGNIIEFYHASAIGGLTKCYNCTDQSKNDEWRWVEFPLGEESGIEPAQIVASTTGHWYQFLGATFDWENVERIYFVTTGDLMDPNDWFIIDGLRMPNVEVKSIEEDLASQGTYKKREKPIYRTDIKSQVELDQVALSSIARMKDPYHTLDVHAFGQTGSIYPGQSLGVLIPNSGIRGATIYDPLKYRITNLEHTVVKDTSLSEYPGVDFITKYELVKHEVSGATQKIDNLRLLKSRSPVKGQIRQNIYDFKWGGGSPPQR